MAFEKQKRSELSFRDLIDLLVLLDEQVVTEDAIKDLIGEAGKKTFPQTLKKTLRQNFQSVLDFFPGGEVREETLAYVAKSFLWIHEVESAREVERHMKDPFLRVKIRTLVAHQTQHPGDFAGARTALNEISEEEPYWRAKAHAFIYKFSHQKEDIESARREARDERIDGFSAAKLWAYIAGISKDSRDLERSYRAANVLDTEEMRIKALAELVRLFDEATR